MTVWKFLVVFVDLRYFTSFSMTVWGFLVVFVDLRYFTSFSMTVWGFLVVFVDLRYFTSFSMTVWGFCIRVDAGCSRLGFVCHIPLQLFHPSVREFCDLGNYLYLQDK